ncbi:Fusaric acid resistance protein-like [Thalassobacillus cyri]|uniref:Fusaric acid resistance protein-like n=1 Tax=Thalassobacillus cyri TaxID=571932 RepID=A0A1H3XR06_9BACI|nr:FUSC family protein [Thalassobacillus cyri]SEA01796.1 Fusaric acid resistance protein-like [Thalassobacillus cyri]
MKQLSLKYYWLGRLLASDPGRKRLNQAGKATLSLISSVFTVIFLFNWIDQEALTPAIVAGMAGMLGIMAVMDDTKQEKQVTTGLLAISAVGGVTLGALFAESVFLVSSLMIVIITSAFYFTRYGSRYFSLGMIGFMTVYISSFLKLSAAQFPWFYLAIAIGISYAFLYNFFIFKDSVHMLRRSIQSFHTQANLTFQLLVEMIQDPEIKESRAKKLHYNVRKLREYASNVATDLNTHDVAEIWPGLTTSQIRLYVFDTAMFVETLAESLSELKRNDAFETAEVRQLLVEVIAALRNADVLAPEYKKENLHSAQRATVKFRDRINLLFDEQGPRPKGRLYLLRRIDSIADHVTNGAIEIQLSLQKGDSESLSTEEHDDEEVAEDEKEEGLKPSTKKALQALMGGTVAVIVGHIISPIQPYWVILTTFIVLLGTETVGRTYLKGFQRSVGTVIGAIIGFGLARLVSSYATIEVALIFVVVFSAFYILTVSYTAMSIFITLLIAFMYDLLLGGISLELLGARVIDTIAGGAIAFLVSAVLLPTKTHDKVNETFADYLEELKGYVIQYVSSFHKPVNVKELAEQAFAMEEKVQAIKDESQPILHRPGAMKHSELSKWITIFTATNYYAKHLVASSYQKNFFYPDELKDVFPKVEKKLEHNIDALIRKIRGEEHIGQLYDLQDEREQIERLAPSTDQGQGDLVHHLYYVWRVNQSLLVLAVKLGLR